MVTRLSPHSFTLRTVRSVTLLFHCMPLGKSPSTYCQFAPLTHIWRGVLACRMMRQVGLSVAKAVYERIASRTTQRMTRILLLCAKRVKDGQNQRVEGCVEQSVGVQCSCDRPTSSCQPCSYASRQDHRRFECSA